MIHLVLFVLCFITSIRCKFPPHSLPTIHTSSLPYHIRVHSCAPSISPSSVPIVSPPSVPSFYTLSLVSSSRGKSALSIIPPIPASRSDDHSAVTLNASSSLLQFVKGHAVNNTVLVMIVDFGYLRLFLNSYFTARLWEYPNLIILCLDIQSYHVILSRHFKHRS